MGLDGYAPSTFPMSREHSTIELKTRDPCFYKQKYSSKNGEMTRVFHLSNSNLFNVIFIEKRCKDESKCPDCYTFVELNLAPC